MPVSLHFKQYSFCKLTDDSQFSDCIKNRAVVKFINIMDIAIYLETLKTAFLPYFKSIQDYHFYYDNLLFWALLLSLYLTLETWFNWSHNKAFFFCANISLVLLGSTWLEKPVMSVFAAAQEEVMADFSLFILKVASLIILSLVVLYFVFVDNS